MNTSLTRAILGGTWLMHPQHADSILPFVAQILRGDTIQEQPIAPKLQVYNASTGVMPGWYSGFTGDHIIENSIAIIPIEGAIMKKDAWWGEPGTETMEEWRKQAEDNPNIIAILFVADGPGGMVNGTQTFAQGIHACKKPTLSLVKDGMACSAIQWLAAAADETWITQKTCIMGSIGVYTTLADIKKYYEAMGIKIHEVYSDLSPLKNKDYKEAMKGNYKLLKDGALNPIATEFRAAMLEYRAGKIAPEGEHLEGKTYMGMECIEVGLADRLGSMEEALAYLSDKAAIQTSNQFFNLNNTEMKFKSAWGAILTAISFGMVKSDDEAPLVTEERLEQLNSSLEAANKTIGEREATIAQLQADAKANGELTASVATLTTEKETLTASVSTLTTERDEWKSKAEKFGKQAGADLNAKTKSDKASEGDACDDMPSEEEQFKSYAHNQKAIEELKNIS